MNFASLGNRAAKSESLNRGTVIGRVLQDDTDFTCYQVAAQKDNSIKQAFNQLLMNLESARRLAGAETVNMHLTMGMKGGRAEMATVSPYQEKRNALKDPEIAYRVGEIRSMLASYKSTRFIPIVNIVQEADDSLRQMQSARITEFGVESSVLHSGDKDLWFTDGIHMEVSGRFYTVDGYGFTNYKEVGNIKPKLIGRGTSWFWHQIIMGDSADNIPGLPTISARLLNRYLPTKTHNPKRKAASCGEAKAVAMLKDVTTEAEAATRVMEAYTEHYGNAAEEMLVEQAFLLWIRSTNKLTEVVTYLRTCGLNVTFTPAQITRLKAYGAKVKQQQAMS